MGFIWSNSFLTFTASAGQAATNFPASRLNDRDHPSRPTRTQDVSVPHNWILDLGSNRPIAAIALLHAKFHKVNLATSVDNSEYTDFPSNFHFINKDKRDTYRKLWIEHSPTCQYIRIQVPSGESVDSDGNAFFELGTVLVMDKIYTLPQFNLGKLGFEFDAPYFRNNRGGHSESLKSGGFFIRMSWKNTVRDNDIEQFQDIAGAGGDLPFLLYLNQNNSNEIYFLQYEGSWRFDYGKTSHNVNASFRQRV